jgi:hypothetical protein
VANVSGFKSQKQCGLVSDSARRAGKIDVHRRRSLSDGAGDRPIARSAEKLGLTVWALTAKLASRGSILAHDIIGRFVKRAGQLKFDVRGDLAGIFGASPKTKAPATTAGATQVALVAGEHNHQKLRHDHCGLLLLSELAVHAPSGLFRATT